MEFDTCPKCGDHMNPGARAHACGWRKRSGEEKAKGPELCCWDDHGLSCGYRGIRSLSTFGGPWYCREHYYRMMGYGGMEGKHGNELPDDVHSQAVDEIRARLKPLKSSPLAKYLPRVPGQDDEEVAA